MLVQVTLEAIGLKVGMRLEAIDRQNPHLLCVATVSKARIKDGRPFVTIHFDGWEDNYNYEVSALAKVWK